VGPRITFLSYWKKNFSQKKEISTSSDAETNVGYINKCSNVDMLFCLDLFNSNIKITLLVQNIKKIILFGI